MKISDKPLTARQADILNYIIDFIESAGYPPSFREIGSYFGIRSTNGVRDHLRALTRKGYIVHDSTARALTVLMDVQKNKVSFKLMKRGE